MQRLEPAFGQAFADHLPRLAPARKAPELMHAQLDDTQDTPTSRRVRRPITTPLDSANACNRVAEVRLLPNSIARPPPSNQLAHYHWSGGHADLYLQCQVRSRPRLPTP